MNQWNCMYQKPASKTCLWSSISIIPDSKRWLVLCSGLYDGSFIALAVSMATDPEESAPADVLWDPICCGSSLFIAPAAHFKRGKAGSHHQS